MTEHLVFTYGTLKKHHHNNYLLQNSQYLGTGTTVEKYAMSVCSIPYVYKHKQISVIHGEVYSVDDTTLARLDQLEGHPQWYKREEVKILVDNADNGQIVTAWLYFNDNVTGELVLSGRFEQR